MEKQINANEIGDDSDNKQKNNCDKVTHEQYQKEREIKLPEGWEEHEDADGSYYWHIATGIIRRERPTEETASLIARDHSSIFYHDDDEINNIQSITIDDDDDEDFSLYSNTQQNTHHGVVGVDFGGLGSGEREFLVCPIGCCDFDEIQLTSTTTSSKAIQKCLLELSGRNELENNDETFCWGLSRDQQILMRFHIDEPKISFVNIFNSQVVHCQPIGEIKVWAINEDIGDFAFVVTETQQTVNNNNENGDENSIPKRTPSHHEFSKIDIDENGSSSDDFEDACTDSKESTKNKNVEEEVTRCYVMRALNDDDMCIKVAAIMNEQMKRIKNKQQLKQEKALKIQQEMQKSNNLVDDDDLLTIEEQAYDDKTFIVKYLGHTQVMKPVGIDVLNNAIDVCVETSEGNDGRSSKNGGVKHFATCGEYTYDSGKNEINHGRSLAGDDLLHLDTGGDNEIETRLLHTNFKKIDCKIHVSPSSIIVESCHDGDVLVECRIRYLTFMGVSKHNIKLYAFIMQIDDHEFQAHCFECHPSAGPVCHAIQRACTKMYQRVVQNDPDTIIQQPNNQPTRSSSMLFTQLRKTLARITTKSS